MGFQCPSDAQAPPDGRGRACRAGADDTARTCEASAAAASSQVRGQPWRGEGSATRGGNRVSSLAAPSAAVGAMCNELGGLFNAAGTMFTRHSPEWRTKRDALSLSGSRAKCPDWDSSVLTTQTHPVSARSRARALRTIACRGAQREVAQPLTSAAGSTPPIGRPKQRPQDPPRSTPGPLCTCPISSRAGSASLYHPVRANSGGPRRAAQVVANTRLGCRRIASAVVYDLQQSSWRARTRAGPRTGGRA